MDPSAIKPLADKRYYIQTGYDGALDGDTSAADVRALVDSLAPDKPVALHLHGGLVGKSDALKAAAALLPAYQAAGVHPIFIVWQTGFLETLTNRLRQVWDEGVFETLVKRLLPHVVGMLQPPGALKARGTTAARPDDEKVADEYDRREKDEEPFKEVKAPPPEQVAPVSEQERQDFQAELEHDPDFTRHANAAVAAWSRGDPEAAGLLSPRILGEPGVDASEARPRGILTIASLVVHAGAVLVRIISRFRKGRDHGVYATVVEEVLREFYITSIGAELWGRMKRQAERSFRSDGVGSPPGGRLLLEELARRFPAGGPPLSIIAHSAGAIYACRLLRHIRDQRAGNTPVGDLRFKNLLLMAPACDFALFASVLGAASSFENVRLFALREALESGYWEVPAIYPRSLLYLVSGAFEVEAGLEQTGAFDLPLVGMERYYTLPKVYPQEEVDRVRRFFAENMERRQVWSVDPRIDGLGCDAKRHGEFFLDADWKPTAAMNSVLFVLSKGW